MTENTPHILFVEDDETLAFVTADSLRLRGFEVSHCSDGKEALRLFNDSHFDLCILDVMLPGMDGFSLAEKIREKDEHIPVLFLTARAMKEDRIHGLSIGGDDYISGDLDESRAMVKMDVTEIEYPDSTFDIKLYPDLLKHNLSKKKLFYVKRIIDIVGCILGLIIFSPFIVIISLLIRLSSEGPILFRQERIGMYGEKFTFLKFLLQK